MERKLPGKFFRKFGYTSRGCPLFWKCRKIVITGAVNRKMLFHSLLEVAGNSNRKFWLNGKRPLCGTWYGKMIPRCKSTCIQTLNAYCLYKLLLNRTCLRKIIYYVVSPAADTWINGFSVKSSSIWSNLRKKGKGGYTQRKTSIVFEKKQLLTCVG